MEELLKFYLLERPRSVSDMIRDLTVKELSDDAAERSEQIPRIAGNWFKKETGYLWRLRESGRIVDQGRQYAWDKDTLVDGFMKDLGLYEHFPDRAVRSGDAEITDAYGRVTEKWRLEMFQRELRQKLFSGKMMQQVFAFQEWQDALLVPEGDGRRIATHRPLLDFWSAVHVMFLSAVFKSRKSQLRALMEERDQYFRWKNRSKRLEKTERAFLEQVIGSCFPSVEQAYDGAYEQEQVQRLVEAFGEKGPVLGEETVELIGDVYLLALHDGVGLFEQQGKHDEDVHLLFNLFERGWLIEERKLEQDLDTGNFIVPLNELHSYLETLVGLMEPAVDLQER